MRLCSIILTNAALTGCTRKYITQPVITMTPKDTATIKADTLTYLALGDSYTIGEAVSQAESFPNQLAAKLTSQTRHVNPPTIIATTGWTEDNLINAFEKSGLPGKHYSFVTLLIGVNDLFQGLSQDNYKTKFQQVLNTAIQFSGYDKTLVFVLSIPDYGVTPFAGGNDAVIGPQIDQFNAINKSISTAAGVHYLDITPISRQAATEPDLIAVDGLHPSGKMYGLWVDGLGTLITKALQ